MFDIAPPENGYIQQFFSCMLSVTLFLFARVSVLAFFQGYMSFTFKQPSMEHKMPGHPQLLKDCLSISTELSLNR